MMAKVYIGVGHGGTDPGACSAGFREKDIALEIGKACAEELKRHGVSVMLSRTSDVTKDVNAKAKECNAYAPNYAIDVHINAGGGNGFEAIHTLSGGKGKMLAANVEKRVKEIGQNSRGLKTRKRPDGKDYFGFIRMTDCPAVILEAGFIDNIADRSQFDEKAEQIAFGVAYAHGILDTLGIKIKPVAVTINYESMVKSLAKLSDSTMNYLKKYPYSEELFRKLYIAMK